jgi:hypothetical protein
MDIGGLVAKAIVLKNQLNKKHCKRCGLPYEKDRKECPHCPTISDDRLEELLVNAQKMQTGNIMYMIFILVLMCGGVGLLIYLF